MKSDQTGVKFMERLPKKNEIYRHFKGNLYKVITLAIHSETREEMVVYQALYGDYSVYVRPLSMFIGPVDKIKYPEAAQEVRFELQNQIIGQAEAGKEERQPERKPQPQQEQEPQPQQEQQIDPLVMEFLESDTYEAKLNILTALHSRITDEMINTLAVAIDVEIPDAETQERYEQLRTCLLTFNKFEGSRLR